MRRSGGLEDDRPDTRPDDSAFISLEDPADDPIVFAPPLLGAEPSKPREALIRRERPVPIAVQPPPSDSGDDVHVLDIMRMLYRRRWLMTAVIAAAVAAAAAYNHFATPIYEARARLLLEPNSPEVVPFRTNTEDQGRLDYYITQLEVLRSRALGRKTLEELHLLTGDETKQSAQITQMLAGLLVAPARSDMGESRVINITFRSPDPELAARIANGLTHTYVDANLASRRQGSREAFEWLSQRMAELKNDVNASEGALQQYRQQKDPVALGDQQNIVVQKLAQLNAAVTTARTERVEKEALYKQLLSIQESGAALDTFTPILSNTFIQGLKSELSARQRERAQLMERLGELHPDMIKVNTAIANAERQLKDEMAKIVAGVQNEYRAAQTKEQGLVTALDEQKREVLSLSQKSIGYGALQRDAASTQQMFEAVRQRMKETELSGELQSNNAKILDAAEVPRGPIWPRAQLNLLIALFGGAFVAVGLAVGAEYVNPRLAKPGDIADALGLPLLGIAPQVPGLHNRPVTLADLPASLRESFRSIRTRIFLSPIAANAQSMAVTSTNPGEGKTMVASNLAVSMAMAGRRVLLIDADLHRPQLHRIFDIPQSPGLSDVMAGKTRPSETLLESAIPGLFILAAGHVVASPTDLLDSERLHHLIKGLCQVFDVVVLDCPPVMALADASIIGHAASSVLFVVGSGATSREAAQVALDRLASVQVQVVGVVLNRAKVDLQSAYGYAV
jgi:capsular exopolysaccharide synthesis family protein